MTAYIVTFDREGFIVSTSISGTRIHHAQQGDTVQFVNSRTATWVKVNIVSQTAGVDKTSLFGATPVNVGDVNSIRHNGTTHAEFSFTPSATLGVDPNPGPLAPPDTGTIKVGS